MFHFRNFVNRTYLISISFEARVQNYYFRLFSIGEICWNTNDRLNQTERFELKAKFDSDLNEGDYTIKTFWRNGQTSTFSALNLKKSCDFGKISYSENDIQVIGIESNVDSFYTVGRIGSRHARYSVTLPDRSFVLEVGTSDWRLRQFEVKFLFGLQRDFPRMQVHLMKIYSQGVTGGQIGP